MIETLLSALTAAGAGAIAIHAIELLKAWRNKGTQEVLCYRDRLSELTSSLTKASAQVDEVLKEISTVATEREAAVTKLEEDLTELEARERQLKERVATLENMPIPVAEHFNELIQAGEKRGARRDYILFGAGVALTTIIAVVMQWFTQ